MKNFHNRTPLIMCLIGGFLLIASSLSGSISTLTETVEHLTEIFGAGFVLTFDVIMGILASLTILGGIGVILAGLIITTRKYTIGRIFMIIFTGMGVIGLIMQLIQLVLAGTIMMDLMIQLHQSLGWLGAIFALLAWTVAEQPPVLTD
ncbi:MAG: hypothetical protein ACFE7R_07960 [Candidatus Hodarchaeota archaeon]